MATRILLVCHGATAATRSTAFPLDEPLEPGQGDAAADLASAVDTASARSTTLGAASWALTGTALRCRQTAQALGLDAVPDPALGDWNLGDWAGRTLTELATAAPQDVEAWLTDPEFTGHGGESLTDVIARVGEWLDQPAGPPGEQADVQWAGPLKGPSGRAARLVVVTHTAWIRAAVVHALRAGPHSFWRIDVAPLCVVELRGGPGRWAFYAQR